MEHEYDGIRYIGRRRPCQDPGVVLGEWALEVLLVVVEHPEPWYVWSFMRNPPPHSHAERTAVVRLYQAGLVTVLRKPPYNSSYVCPTPEALEHPQVLEGLWAQEAPPRKDNHMTTSNPRILRIGLALLRYRLQERPYGR